MKPSDRIPRTLKIDRAPYLQIDHTDLAEASDTQVFGTTWPANRILQGFLIAIPEAFLLDGGDLLLRVYSYDLGVDLFADFGLSATNSGTLISLALHELPLPLTDGFDLNFEITSTVGNVADRDPVGQINISAVYHPLTLPVNPLVIEAYGEGGALYIDTSERFQSGVPNVAAYSFEGVNVEDLTIEEIDEETGFIWFSCTGNPTGGYLIFDPNVDGTIYSISGGALGPQRIYIQAD